MNIYKPDENGNATGIGWTKPPGAVAGATWNPIAGCYHDCEFLMPDGVTISCYAAAIANRFTKAYPDGFRHRYWHPERLTEPGRKKEPHGIFVGSMADVFGNWVFGKQIDAVLDVCRDTPQHTYFMLTKNPRRMLDFDLPDNVWAGCSLPATIKPSPNEFDKYDPPHYSMIANLDYMAKVLATVRWFSVEPLWFDVAKTLRYWIKFGFPLPFEWLVIGAGSDGNRLLQPKAEWVQGLLDVADEYGIPVFMKKNLSWPGRMMEFPDVIERIE